MACASGNSTFPALVAALGHLFFVLGNIGARLVLLSQAFLVLGRWAIRVMGGARLGLFGVTGCSRGSGWLVHVVSSC